MPKYTAFWKKIVDRIKNEINPETPYENQLSQPELAEIGDLKSYGGKLEFFVFEIRSCSDNQVFKDLFDLISAEKAWRRDLTGELIIRIKDQTEVSVQYTPFSWEAMMNRYRDYQDRTQMEEEVYKWKLVKDFQENWKHYEKGDLSFLDLVEKTDFSNLVYRMFSSNFKFVVRERTSEVEAEFTRLFDENVDFQDRVTRFKDRLTELHAQIKTKPKDQLFLYEREISTILTYRYPDSYCFFMPKFYDPLTRLENGVKKNAGYQLADYYRIVADFKKNVLPQCEDVIAVKNRIIGRDDFYKDDEHLLIIQDIFYVTLAKKASLKKNKDSDQEEPFAVFTSKEIAQFFAVLDSLIADFDLKESDERLVFTTTDDRLNFIIGQRYTFTLYPPPERKEESVFSILSSTPFSQKHGQFEGKPLAFFNRIDSITQPGSVWLDIKRGLKTELDRSEKSSFRKYDLTELRKMAFDRDYRKERLDQLNLTYDQPIKLIMENQNKSLNTILYGPPGTGKTYNTIDRAVQIAAPDDYTPDDHYNNKQVYDGLVESRQIQLTTFHQSLTYEDFVEGIKPKLGEESKDDIQYEMQSGIFKQMCQDAKVISTNPMDVDWDKVNFAKMSLGGKARPDIHEWCIENNYIALGWGRNEDLTSLMNYKDWDSYMKKFKELFPGLAEESRYNIQACFIFQHNLSIGDIVVVTKGNNIIDAIGVVEGSYLFNPDAEIEYSQFKPVKWISTEMDASPERFFSRKISQQTIYMFDKETVKLDGFKSLTDASDKEPKQFVLIIDEINRGNVSSIFGELITLIENDKRSGADEGLSVMLPYSKKPFSVPNNIHIIGTMNTADRSVEALDTALRRRFSFVEMSPKYDLEELEKEVSGVQLSMLLRRINDRIEKLLDKDHLIGHAYLIDVKSDGDLSEVFNDKITPLLQEYFYNDFAKIGMVLGKGFVQKKSDYHNFANFDDGVNSDYENRDVYEIKRVDADGLQAAIADLMNENKDKVEEA